jgi:hypothetical protein
MQRLIETLVLVAAGRVEAARGRRPGSAEGRAARDSRSPFQQIIGRRAGKGFWAWLFGRTDLFFNHAAAPVPCAVVGALAGGNSFNRSAFVVGALHNPSLQPTCARYAGLAG